MATAVAAVGCLAIMLGGAGVIGLLDRSGFTLYRQSSGGPAPAEQHRALQRAGGAVLLVVGVVFLVLGLTG
jgi:uncharacterized iron-regulated membrane protein